MKQKKCLIAGLPDAGKSTYLGALWYVINNDNKRSGYALKASENNLPENVEQLSALSQKWMKVEDMERTSLDVPSNISFNLTPRSGGEDITLNVPDFKGESIRQVITYNQPKEFDEWLESSDTLLYLVSEVRPDRFADDYELDEDEQEAGNQQAQAGSMPDFDIKKMQQCAQNMLILRYLATHKHFSKVVFCLTAWDKVEAEQTGQTPEDYLREESPAFYNFIRYHFPQSTFFGLSAQGAEYEYETYDGKDGSEHKRVTDACRKNLQTATLKGERAFVVAGNVKSNDITLPIAELLK